MVNMCPTKLPGAFVSRRRTDLKMSTSRQSEQIATLNQKLATIRTRMDQIYEDKLDGKIDERFWSRKQSALREQE